MNRPYSRTIDFYFFNLVLDGLSWVVVWSFLLTCFLPNNLFYMLKLRPLVMYKFCTFPVNFCNHLILLVYSWLLVRIRRGLDTVVRSLRTSYPTLNLWIWVIRQILLSFSIRTFRSCTSTPCIFATLAIKRVRPSKLLLCLLRFFLFFWVLSLSRPSWRRLHARKIVHELKSGS